MTEERERRSGPSKNSAREPTRSGPVAAQPAARRTPLDRALSLFTEVRAGEGVSALLLTLNVFLLLAAYYFLKTIREPLVLAAGGATVKAYAASGQAVLLVPFVAAYSAVAKRFGRMVLITATTLFFASNLIVFYVLGVAGVKIGVPFYLWVGCFSLTVIAQAWSFANDVYTPEQGKRLFAIVGVGSSLGAVAGARLAASLVVWIGIYQMMLAAAATLLVCLGIMFTVHRLHLAAVARSPGGDEEHAKKEAEATQKIAGAGAFRTIFRDRYLVLMAVLSLLLNWVNSTGEFILDTHIETWANDLVARGASDGLGFKELVGQFRGKFFFWVNAIGAFMQLFLVSRIFKYIGVGRALLILPIIALGGYTLMIVAPVLAFVRIAKISENSVDYSIQNTARQSLFLPTSREAKYSAKAAIDTFFVRAGDVLSGGVVFIGSELLHLSTKQFAMWNLVLVATWLVIAIKLGRMFRERTGEGGPGPASGAGKGARGAASEASAANA